MEDVDTWREQKLPVWARQRLRAARDRADRAESQLAAHMETVEQTSIWYGDYQNPIYIPRHYGHQRVHFKLGEDTVGSWNEVQVGIRDGGLEIMASRAMTIEPQVSNVVLVRLRDK